MNVRIRGLPKDELDTHLAELDEAFPTEEQPGDSPEDLAAAEREIAWLRKEVSDLREQAALVIDRDAVQRKKQPANLWLAIAVTAAGAWALTRLPRS